MIAIKSLPIPSLPGFQFVFASPQPPYKGPLTSSFLSAVPPMLHPTSYCPSHRCYFTALPSDFRRHGKLLEVKSKVIRSVRISCLSLSFPVDRVLSMQCSFFSPFLCPTHICSLPELSTIHLCPHMISAPLARSFRLSRSGQPVFLEAF